MSKDVIGKFRDSASSLSPKAVEGRFASLMYWCVRAVEPADEEVLGMNIIGLGRFEVLFAEDACCCCCCCACCRCENRSCGLTWFENVCSCLMFFGGVSRDMVSARKGKVMLVSHSCHPLSST